MPSSLLVFLLFAVLLSLHLHTFLMFFTLVYLVFIAAYLIAFTPQTVHNFWVRSCSTHAHKWRKWRRTWSHSYRVGGLISSASCMRLRSSQKAMGSSTAQCKMLLFCAKPVWRKKKKKKKKKKKTDFGGLATFWRGTFSTVIKVHDTGSLLGQENTRRRMVSCHKGLFAARFWDLERFGKIFLY